jgi:feruloyl esterase
MIKMNDNPNAKGLPACGIWHRSVYAIALAGAFSAVGHAQPAVSCDSLAKMSLPSAAITAAQSYAAGEFKVPRTGGGPGGPAGPPGGPGGPGSPAGTGAPPAGGAGGGAGLPNAQQNAGPIPAFCRVSLTLTPSSDSDIKTEVWLPTSGWNGKFVGVANFGTGGSLQYGNMVIALNGGYALAANDTGHQGNGASFAVGHPEKMIDYAYRADHEMTVRAKEIVAKFYGKPASRSIWIGCSLGGVEALIEAKRYPEDYDGIIAGAPPNPFPLFNAEQIWGAWLNVNHPESSIPLEKFPMIHKAALKACDTPVGLAQGFIEDPEHCNFKPESLLCKEGDAADCLTASQVERLKQLYQGPTDPRTGKVIFPGPAVGAESELASRNPVGPAVDLYRYMVYQDPKWDWKNIDFAASVDKAKEVIDPLLVVDDNLNSFLNRGGKLMLYVGWTEGHNANELAAYYKRVIKNAGPAKANNVRLFLVPGMNHCGGGAGCDTFEKLGIVDQWVQSGKAPNQILSSKLSDGQTIRTRPLCAYPAVATYKGAGSMDDAASFSCVVP